MAGMNRLHAVVLGVLLGSTAVIGDLIESLFKREAGVKDSGGLFPGIGGILDLLDSLLFNAPIMYLVFAAYPHASMKNVTSCSACHSVQHRLHRHQHRQGGRGFAGSHPPGRPGRRQQCRTAAQTNAQKHRPEAISINNPGQVPRVGKSLGATTQVYSGDEGLIKLATLPAADIVLIAIVGTAGLKPALAAIRAGKDIAIASKEILVMAGEIVMSEARKHGVRVLAVDSEHSAIFQCLDGKPPSSVRKLWLTASGGPFRKRPEGGISQHHRRARAQTSVVGHGPKITIDSATLFNKGLEMIEARWLFDIGMERVGVLVHPQSIVHSMVEFVDGALLAQLSTPDMCLPIQYALTYPDRAPSDRVQTDFAKLGSLTFEEPDEERFPALNSRAGQGRRAARCRRC
jgi:1-deoxy-D-xylulose 5-phosphate reductoisomerase